MNSKLVWISMVAGIALSAAGQLAAPAQISPDGSPLPVVKPEPPKLADAANPYGVILDRNVFRLVPPPPPPPPPAAPDLVQSNIKLTGFIKTSGKQLRALFVSVPKDAKTEPSYYNLAEGERDGTLEVIKIIEDKETADVMHAGIRLTVKLQDSKPTNSITPAGPGPGQQPGNVAGAAGAPAQSGSGVMVAGGAALPAPPSANPAGPGGAPNAAGTLPTRSIRTATPAPPTVPTYQPQTRDESAAYMVVSHAQQGQDGPPMPPIPGMEEDQSSSVPNVQTPPNARNPYRH